MKRFKFYAVMVSLCLIVFNSTAQQQQQPLKIGDIVPDITLNNIINYKKKSAKISDFKGKILIIDFWATWCSPCVWFLGKADSLQKQFGEQIEILPVTSESEAIAKPFLDKLKRHKQFLPASVIQDTMLKQMFPHIYIPHEVWIDQKGKVIAITGYDLVTTENINKALKGELGNLPVKIDEKFETTALTESPVQDSLAKGKTKQSIFNCYFGKYENGGLQGASLQNNTRKLECSNYPILDLYQVAYGKFKPEFGRPRVIVESEDSHITFPKNKPHEEVVAWWKQNAYCYRISADTSIIADELFIKMQDDINRFFRMKFGIEGIVEKRKVSYWALVRTSKRDKLATHFPNENENIGYDKRFSMSVKNAPFWKFLYPIQGYNLQMERVVDETGFDQSKKIDITLDCELMKIDSLNKELTKYDLQLVKKEGMLDMIIIRDVKKQTSK